MKYFRVKPESDNVRTKFKSFEFLIQNEILTEKEKIKTGLPSIHFTEIEENPKNTYFCFGARFTKSVGYSN